MPRQTAAAAFQNNLKRPYALKCIHNILPWKIMNLFIMFLLVFSQYQLAI
jgi:hypothetical protein